MQVLCTLESLHLKSIAYYVMYLSIQCNWVFNFQASPVKYVFFVIESD